jgi:hypothetical protein
MTSRASRSLVARTPPPARGRLAGAADRRQQIAHGASIVAVRVWPAEDYSRVTIESDRRCRPRTFVASPPRLAVDIEACD